MPRFVVLKHDWNGVHYDLMLERDAILRTWSLPTPLAEDRAILANALPDHRMAYLDYEGPVSRERGNVSRVAQGEYAVCHWTDDRIEVELHGDQLNGKLVLWLAETGESARTAEWWVRFGKRD